MKVCPTCQLKYPDDKGRCFVDGAELALMPDERIGQLLGGRYLIEAPLGEGGMAIVYRARHTLVDRPVAVKMMAKHLATDQSLRERFRREAKNAQTLAHPNIVEIIDTGETEDGSAYLVMELLEGQSLGGLLEKGPLQPGQVAEIALQVARGLARAHDFQVIHRDLKPDNIFLAKGRDGRLLVKLLDFGIARSLHDSRLTNAGEIFGTPQYMAPERVTSIDAGPLADLYALGVIMWEMVVGHVPFDADGLPGILIKHMSEAPVRPSTLVPNVPRRLEELILKLLEKKPEARPVDAHQVIRELTALVPAEVAAEAMLPTPAAGITRPVAPTLPPTTLERWARRVAVFEQMIGRAFPSGAPADILGALAQLKQTIGQINEQRSLGLREQRKVDAMEANVRDAFGRLGHAMDVLGVDLSHAREAVRAAHLEVAPYFDAETQAQAAWGRAQQRLAAAGVPQVVSAPSQEVVHALREAADTVDRWLLSKGAADKARRWVEAKDREVSDLEFQIEALRGQRDRAQATAEEERGATEKLLLESGKKIEALDQLLMSLAGKLVEPLRIRNELGDLFGQLEREG